MKRYIQREFRMRRDPKVKRLGRGLEGRSAVLLLEELWCLCGELDRGGTFKPDDLDPEIVADELSWWGYTGDEVATLLERLYAGGFLVLEDDGSTTVAGWGERYHDDRRTSEARVCLRCQTPFEARRRWQKYCSAACRKAHHDASDALPDASADAFPTQEPTHPDASRRDDALCVVPEQSRAEPTEPTEPTTTTTPSRPPGGGGGDDGDALTIVFAAQLAENGIREDTAGLARSLRDQGMAMGELLALFEQAKIHRDPDRDWRGLCVKWIRAGKCREVLEAASPGDVVPSQAFGVLPEFQATDEDREAALAAEREQHGEVAP